MRTNIAGVSQYEPILGFSRFVRIGDASHDSGTIGGGTRTCRVPDTIARSTSRMLCARVASRRAPGLSPPA